MQNKETLLLLNKIFGVSVDCELIVKKRLEVEFEKKKKLSWFSNCYVFIYDIVFLNFKLFDYRYIYFLNLLLYCLLLCYRGFRFFFNLPVNGQRTWSNGNSCYYISKVFLIFRYNFFKRKNLNLIFIHFFSFIFIEYINLIWKLQWYSEWLFCFYKNTLKRINYDNIKNLVYSENVVFNKNILFFNLINIKKGLFCYKQNSFFDFNVIGFLPGKYRSIIR